MKRVLVTGASGFLGGHLVARLEKESWCGEILSPSRAEYDLCEVQSIREMYSDLNPDIVIHLAASVGGIGANRNHPARFFYDNAVMGVHLMHEAYKSGVDKFVTIGTVCSYPKFTPVPFKEESLWDGYPEETNAPYGLAKKMLLVQAQTYREDYGFNAVYLIMVNLYGPGDNFDLETGHVVPSLIRKFAEAKETNAPTVELWGDGSPTRELFYVEDAAEAIVRATEHYNDSQPVNLGTGKDVSIRDLAEMIQKEVGYTGSIVWNTAQPNGQPARRLDVSKAKKLFDFEAKTDLAMGLKNTVAWYNQNRDSLRTVQFASEASGT